MSTNATTSVPHFIKQDGSERQYMSREQSLDMLRGLAFAGNTSAKWGNVAEGIGVDLADEARRSAIRQDLRHRGITPEEARHAAIELCHCLGARLDNLGDWKIEVEEDSRDCAPHVALNGLVAIFPEVKNGRGRMLRTVYAVQSLDIDDADPEYDTEDAAIIDAATRLESKRITAALTNNNATTPQ